MADVDQDGSRGNKPRSRLADEDVTLLVAAVRRMGEFLRSPSDFENAVRQRFSPLPDKWQKTLEMLPDKPILGERDGEPRWLFDFSGTAIVAAAVATPGALPLPAVPPAPVEREALTERPEQRPEPAPQDAVAARRREIDAVRETQAAVREFTGDRVNLEKLAVELRLLDVSPPYSTFDDAAKRYLASAGSGPTETPYPSLTADVAILQEYWRLVTRSWLAIKRSVFLAEVLATQYPEGRSARTRTYALRLLSQDLEFGRRPPPDLEAMLGELQAELKAGQGVEVPDASPITKSWVNTVTNNAKLAELALQRNTLPASEYFMGRFDALILHMRSGDLLRRPTLQELFLRARNLVPAFFGDPNTMTLRAFAAALEHPHAGNEFKLAVLVKLGFGEQIQRWLQVNKGAGLEREKLADLQEACSQVLRTGERVALAIGGEPEERDPFGEVVRAWGTGSIAQAWVPSQRHAVLPMLVGTSALPFETVALNLSLVLYEEGNTAQTLPAGPRQVQLVKSPTGKTSPFVVQPQSLDEAVVKALEVLRPA